MFTCSAGKASRRILARVSTARKYRACVAVKQNADQGVSRSPVAALFPPCFTGPRLFPTV